jgi:hypothetical protein
MNNQERTKLIALRARARKFGMSIRFHRSRTCIGWYELRHMESTMLYADGLEDLQDRIVRLEAKFGDLSRKLPAEQVYQAALAVRDEVATERRERFLASKEPVCSFCKAPSDSSEEYRVGPEDVYAWVHVRCNDAFREANERAYQEWLAKASRGQDVYL